MAKLDEVTKEAWQKALRSPDGDWIVFGVNLTEPSFANRLDGMAGLIDWQLHGQVSRLMKNGELEPDTFCWLRGPGAKTYPNFLCYAFAKPSSKELFKKLASLGVKNFLYAATTFPEDFPAKLEQNSTKEGLTCTKLEQ